jgi:hypothetical protein
VLLFFAPAALTSAEFTYRDTGRMHAPMKQWIGQELAQGRLPEWNPHAGLGAPVVANAVDAVQHPLSVLFIALPPGIAMKLWILWAFVAAALGAFAWARALGRTEAASAVAAFAFALSGPIVSASDNVTYLTAYATLPWLLAAAQMHARHGGPACLAWSASRHGLRCRGRSTVMGDRSSAASGQALLFAPPTAAGWPPRGFGRGDGRSWSRPCSSRSPAAAPTRRVGWLSGAHTVEPTRVGSSSSSFRRSSRRPPDPIRSGVQVKQVGNPWFLSIYLGSSVVSVALVGAARDPRYRVLGFLVLAFVWAALGHHAGFVQLAANVPLVGSFRFWEKLAACVALIVAACAARGVDALEARETALGGRTVRSLPSLPWPAVAVLAVFFPRFVVQFTEASGGSEAVAANLGRGATHVAVVLGALALIRRWSGAAGSPRSHSRSGW